LAQTFSGRGCAKRSDQNGEQGDFAHQPNIQGSSVAAQAYFLEGPGRSLLTGNPVPSTQDDPLEIHLKGLRAGGFAQEFLTAPAIGADATGEQASGRGPAGKDGKARRQLQQDEENECVAANWRSPQTRK
jgi:hypothetical protein